MTTKNLMIAKQLLALAKDIDLVKAARRSMTYGVLPSFEEFSVAFDECVNGDKYRFRNMKSNFVGDEDLPKDALWELLQDLVAVHNSDDVSSEEAGDLASSILSTLEFEWI